MSLAFVILLMVSMLAVSMVKLQHKGPVTATGVLASALFTSWFAVGALTGTPVNVVLSGGLVFGDIALRLDSVSAWFVLVTNITLVTGILYGQQYLKHYQRRPADMTLHYVSYLLIHAALTSLYFIQHTLAFLCAWEIMALSAFVLVIFEYNRGETLKAGINYLIQSHVSILFLTLGSIWLYTKTGSFDFNAVRTYCLTGSREACLLLFLVFFVGFGIKAGFVPFHTWLPHAHPAAPSHVSGVMSGVLIKTGIYGIMRMVLLMPENHLAIGYFVLVISVITGVYGVMLAIVQHNIKRLLAYHSIENIGIIGIGIGIGAIGSGLHNPYMAFAGFAGALLHTLNHSLFKSLLFYSAGNVYCALHTPAIERMGGLIRTMPHTTLLFLLASLAICGLPPFNGFISEFLIYTGLFSGIAANQSASMIVLAVAGLALIGGLALLCFTKAFGIIFLGTRRHEPSHTAHEANGAALFPAYFIAALMVFIGLFPGLFIQLLEAPVGLFSALPPDMAASDTTLLMQHISLALWGLILLTAVLFAVRKAVTRKASVTQAETWDCGYGMSSPRLQYTASSFARSYAKLIRPLIETRKSQDEPGDIIPRPIVSETHFYDKMEIKLIDIPVRNLKGLLGKFKFLQNGSVQFYVLYGVVFIGIAIAIPLIISGVQQLFEILKQM